MASNSKLTKEQKAERKEMLDALPRGSEMTLTPCGVTVLIVPNGCTNLMSTAVASPDEVKQRREVGQYHALLRYFDGIAIPVPMEFTIVDACEPFGGAEWCEEEADYNIFYKE
jgi:hypothetical protein